MNELEIKQVPFMGNELTAARDENGQIWAGVSYICKGIGLGKNEKDRQVKNVQSDKVLSKGCVKFDAGVFDPNNATVALKLDFVPLWLAKINITPTMEAETPELAERLEQYQLKAKDVLAAAFLSKASGTAKPGKTEAQLAAETKRANAMLLNAKNRVADRLQRLYDRANVKPEYQALAIGEMFAEDGVKLPRIALAGTKVTYDKGTIADRLGILSKNGNPHAQAVGAIIADLQIEAEETEAVPFHRHGHDGTDVQYTESVIGKVDDWLARHGYPTTILGRAGKEFCIRYRDELISDHAR